MAALRPSNYRQTRRPLSSGISEKVVHFTDAAPSIAQAPKAFRSHMVTKAEWRAKDRSRGRTGRRRIGHAGRRGLVQPPRCLNVVLSGPWLGAARARVGVVQSPWNRLSGVRFSCTTRMMCWNEVIWAEAGVVRQSAASVNGNSRFIHLPPARFVDRGITT